MVLADGGIRIPYREPETCARSGPAYRAWSDGRDDARILEVMRRSLAADGNHDPGTLEDVTRRHATTTPQFDPRRDTVLAQDGARVVGYCRTWWYEELADRRLYNIVGYLLPEYRGLGIWRSMLRRCEARAREVSVGHPAGIRRILQAWSGEPEVDWPTLLASEGYREVRHFHDMLRPASMETAFLGVDEENPSGTMAFFEGMGYRAARKDTWHRKWLVEPAGAEEAWLQ